MPKILNELRGHKYVIFEKLYPIINFAISNIIYIYLTTAHRILLMKLKKDISKYFKDFSTKRIE